MIHPLDEGVTNEWIELQAGKKLLKINKNVSKDIYDFDLKLGFFWRSFVFASLIKFEILH
jgi:hypothetical protein